MENITFYGIDTSNEISLLDYGLLVSNEEHEDGSKTHFCIYKIMDDNFGCGHFSEETINGFVLGKEFLNDKDLDGFLNYCGCTKDEFLDLNLAQKMTDLISYWGIDNICGTDYNPMTEREVTQRYLKTS